MADSVESIDIAIEKALKQVSIDSLKDKQREILDAILDNKNCVAILPTGYGESLPYQLYLPNEEARLSSYGVTSNSKICLVVCLYDIPEYFDHVVFDLYWGLPMTETRSWFSFLGFGTKDYKVDFLDASCLMFCGLDHYKTIDFRQTSESSVVHSGDRIDHASKTGHHTIDVHISNIPHDVTHLFFTLSAWNSPSISKYPNPSLKFFKASNREKDLCKTSFSHAGNSQAVILCSVSKSSGNWKIFESGKLSAGNARDYVPLVTTITKPIDSGY